MTIELALTKGYIAIIDDIDAAFAAHKWTASVQNGRIYAHRKDHYINVMLARAIFSAMIGRPLLIHELVDHIDNNPLNNRRENLRLATRRQNGQNSKLRSHNSFGVKGVRRRGNKYSARIVVDGKEIHLGTFYTLDEAAQAYRTAAVLHFGEFARFE